MSICRDWRSGLKQAAPDSLLDDHSHWIARLRELARSVRMDRLRHPVPDRRGDGGGGFLRDPRRPSGPSRDGGAAASDGRPFRLHRPRLRMALFPFGAAGRGGGRGFGRDRVPGCRRAAIRRRRGGAVPAALGAQARRTALASHRSGGDRRDRPRHRAAYPSWRCSEPSIERVRNSPFFQSLLGKMRNRSQYSNLGTRNWKLCGAETNRPHRRRRSISLASSSS